MSESVERAKNANRWDNFLADLYDNQEMTYRVTLEQIPTDNIWNAARLIKDVCAACDDVPENTKRDMRWLSCDNLLDFIHNRPDYKPAKAVERGVKESYNYKLPNDVKEKIGSLLRQIKLDVQLLVSLGCDGDPKDYYHESSCWWGEYSRSRDFVEHNYGGALRAYDTSGDIIGRVWFMPHKDGMVLFNAYGQGDLQHVDTWGILLAQALNQQSHKVDADFNKSSCDGIYINSTHCNLVGFDVQDIDSVEVKLKTPKAWQYDNTVRCCICGDHVHEDNAYYVEYESDFVCEYCLNDNYIYLNSCDEYRPVDQCVEVQHYTRRGTLVWEWFDMDDSDIVYVEGEYRHVDQCVVDEHGTWYTEDSSDYCICDDGIWPIDECTYNEETEEYEHD